MADAEENAFASATTLEELDAMYKRAIEPENLRQNEEQSQEELDETAKRLRDDYLARGKQITDANESAKLNNPYRGMEWPNP